MYPAKAIKTSLDGVSSQPQRSGRTPKILEDGMTIRTPILLTGEEEGKKKNHLRLGMTALVRIRGGVDGKVIKDGLLERTVGERKLTKQKTVTGKVQETSQCLVGVKVGKMRLELGVMVQIQALLQRVDGTIVKELQHGARRVDSPTPGTSSSNSTSSNSRSLLVPGVHRPKLPVTGGLQTQTGTMDHSQLPPKRRSLVAGKNLLHSQSVEKWILMMALQRGEIPAVITTRM